jgi:hypothetical protein
MGMYTSIIHPKDGRELQIKTGNDSCDTYKVGDTVSFFVNKNIFGCGGIFDGIYSSYSDKGPDDWVIIKNHKVVLVKAKKFKYETLIKKYKIKEPNITLWTARAYQEHRRRQKELKEENDAFMKSIKNLSPEKKMGAILSRPLAKSIGWESLTRKTFVVEKL